MYYNNRQVAIYSLPGLLHNAPFKALTLTIGGDKTGELGEWDIFNGYIGTTTLYNRCLSASQIQQHYSGVAHTPQPTYTLTPADTLRVITYNIWHGGNETGKAIGYKRIADIIKSSGADVVTMQETYGSGARIADELGFYFYLRSSNISIMSRYPILETLKSSASFNNGNVLLEVGNKKVVVASVWLNYPVDYWGPIDRKEKLNVTQWLKEQQGNRKTMEGIIHSLKPRLAVSDTIPIILAGDFNSGSYLDWIPALKSKNAGYVMPFPTGKYLDSLGFRDTYRTLHPNPVKDRGITWTPINPNTHQDRIDYIYIKGKTISAINSRVINTHPVRYPSDHAAVVSTLLIE